MIAAGAYLLTVREAGRFSAREVAAHIRETTGEGTTDTQVRRIERGQPTAAHVLAAFATFVGANPAQLFGLLSARDASAERGRELALAWLELTHEERERILRIALAHDRDTLRTALASLRRLLSALDEDPP